MSQSSTKKDWPIDWALPPSDDELVFFLEEPVESDVHRDLAALLIQLLRVVLGRSSYVGGNQAIYFSELQVRNRDFLVPDVFVVAGETTDEPRLGWVVWKEGGRAPDLVIEILSSSTEAEDRGRKKEIYERLLHVREYFMFDPATDVLEGLRLSERGYGRIEPDAEGRLRSDVIDGYLAPIACRYQGRDRVWVRLFDTHGELVPTDAEETQRARTEAEAAMSEAEAAKSEAEAAKSEAEAAKSQAEAAKSEAEALAARLAAYEARFGPLDR